ncbi:MAG: phosphatidate cytidylyltransferase [Lachnospiraceae bacterium]
MFITRVCSSIVLVIVTATCLVCGGPLLAGVLLAISLVAFYELSKAVGIHEEKKKANGLELVATLGIIAYYVVMYFANRYVFLCFALVMTFLAIMFVYVFSFPKFHANQVMSTFYSVIYAPVLLSFLYLTRELEQGVYIVWMIFISSWGCDTFAYLTGMQLGKHKLAPALSPKKSIEGAVGGVIGASAVGGLFGYIMVHLAAATPDVIPVFAVIGAIGAVISQVGDLAASAIKRNHDIKDYGKLIPGHGGIMDRFDSVIFAAPMIYFLAVFLL